MAQVDLAIACKGVDTGMALSTEGSKVVDMAGAMVDKLAATLGVGQSAGGEIDPSDGGVAAAASLHHEEKESNNIKCKT